MCDHCSFLFLYHFVGGNSLAIQLLGLCAFTAGAWVQSQEAEIRSQKLSGTAKKKKKKTKQTEKNILLESSKNHASLLHIKNVRMFSTNGGETIGYEHSTDWR